VTPAVKSYPYDHRIDILEYAHSQDADEALVSNTDEKICEGSVSNILMKIGDHWMTPPLSDGVLPGVMRALVIEYFGVTVKSIATVDLSKVQSAILLSSLRIAQPVASIEGRELDQSLEFLKEIQAMALRTSVG
jgi:branched-chain amino acid aminotransferase